MRSTGMLACATLLALAAAPRDAASQQLLRGERETKIAAIDGIVAADAKWAMIWADFETADGIVGTPDGGVLFAQEQTDTIRKLVANGREFVFVKDTHGAGAVSMD